MQSAHSVLLVLTVTFVQAIWQELQDAVHAVDEMQTLTPGEA